MAEQQVQQQQCTEQHKRVVAIAVDESEHSSEAFDYYVQNVKRDDDYVVLIHTPEMYDLTMASPAVVDQLLRELAGRVTKLEEKYKTMMHDSKCGGKFRTGSGKPGEVVCKFAEVEKANIIVTGTRGQGTVRRTFLGSVSDYIIHHAHCPVLVCRSPAKGK